MIKKICIQSSSLGEKAAIKYFGKKIQIISCNTPDELFAITENRAGIHAAILPVENSQSGSILHHYSLLKKCSLKITGEIYLETEEYNYSRFAVLQGKFKPNQNANKASLYFEVDHYKGSLARALSILAGLDINLSKLHSVLLPHRMWAFGFFADLEFDSQDEFCTAVDRMKEVAAEIYSYGIYKKGQQPLY